MMDLQSDCSVLESVEDNEVVVRNPERKLTNFDGNNVENNGSCGGEYGDDHKEIGVTESVISPLSRVTRKGYGLKKWRRIKREFNRDGSSDLDTSKILLKRGLSTSVANSSRPQGLSAETRQKSDSSLSSTRAVVNNRLDSRLGGGLNFSAGADSENSEDRSSKSSTAASVPRLSGRDKNRVKNLSGKNVVHGGQLGKSRVEASKKHRGERVKIEKENSHSSMESDSRSSNFVFMQGTDSVTSNGRQSGMNYDGGNSDEAQGGEQQFSEELQTGNGKENAGELKDLLQGNLAVDLSWEVKENKVENHRSSTDLDPLVESIFTLQSAREALEKEVRKLKEIGNEQISFFDGSNMERNLPSEFASVNPKNLEASSSDLLHSGEITQISSHFLEMQLISLKQNVNLLESKLEEATAVLEAKDAKVIELEYALKSNESLKEELRRSTASQQKKYREMEAELEGLFKQKIEAEVEYLAISRTIPKLRVTAVDQVELFEEQKTLALEQAQVFNELGDAEGKAGIRKRQTENLKTYCEDILGTDQILKLQNRACKVTSCFVIQLILLFVVFALFFLQLSPHYVGVVPT